MNMTLNLDGLELSEEILAKINSQNEGLVSASEIAGLKQNRDDLLSEKKAAQEATTAAEALAEKERLAAMEAKNDNKGLAESYKAELEKYKLREKETAAKLEKQAVSNKALELAKTISSGDNADLLATFIQERLRSEGGEIKVTDANGNLTISSQEDLLNEFKGNQRYASLVVATNASGGSSTTATKHNGSAVVDKANPEAVRKAGIEARLAAAGIQLKQ